MMNEEEWHQMEDKFSKVNPKSLKILLDEMHKMGKKKKMFKLN